MTQAAPQTGNGKRMALTSIRTGRRRTADRILLAGTEGVGKTTWAADAPAPIFIPAEDGIGELDVASFPKPESFADVLEAIRELRRTQHNYKTVVIDTVDAVEPLVWAELCAMNKWENIEAPGYGKGYALTGDSWRRMLVELEGLQGDKNMDVILLAHTAIKPFSNPAGADYSRYEIKLHRVAAALLKEWTKVNLFAVHEEFTKKDKNEMKVKGVSTGRRVVHTQRTAAWDAKNRYGLPPELPLSYADYAAAREAGQPASPDALKAEAIALLADLAPNADTKEKITKAITDAGGDATRLAKCVDRLRSLVAEKEQAA